jgi:outer membrane protein insertion porin family
LSRWLILRTGAELGWGDSYGKTAKSTCYTHTSTGAIDPLGPATKCGLPFFKHFYAGGPSSVRGFQPNTLGPLDETATFNRAQPLGGPIKSTGSFEFIFPTLINAAGARLSAFVDYGAVFASRQDFEFDKIRVSTGLALQWQSPMGPISISYSVPIRYEKGSLFDPDGTGPQQPYLVGEDQIERLQFTFGNQQ